MWSSSIALVGAGLVLTAHCHLLQGILLVNGTETKEWQYVRNVAGLFDIEDEVLKEYPWLQYNKMPPQYDIYNTNITCGRNAFSFASQTETADVLAGSEVGFRVSYDGISDVGPGKNYYGEPTFWHEGPGMIYLSRAPNDDLEHYSGEDGEWFKIAYAGPKSKGEWLLPGTRDFNFTIPLTTPPGKYLMRTEYFMPYYYLDKAQWYINCAQVNIIGPGGGKPTEFAKFPGTYQMDDPGIWVPDNQFGQGSPDTDLSQYLPPGPPVWRG